MRESGDISIPLFRAYGGVYVPISFGDMSGGHTVLSFVFKWIRKGELLEEVVNINGIFNDEIRSLFPGFRSGDQILIDDIRVIMPGEDNARQIESLLFTLK
ncbi:MAG: hypothetical protein GYB31_12685 [Bacteroidetes bacterium]|nr:hypothetical protein [Bacteroidota bacterium]